MDIERMYTFQSTTTRALDNSISKLENESLANGLKCEAKATPFVNRHPAPNQPKCSSSDCCNLVIADCRPAPN